MSIANQIYSQLEDSPFSYGSSLSLILEKNGKAISNLPNEDFVFSDNSILRLTNNNIQLLELLEE